MNSPAPSRCFMWSYNIVVGINKSLDLKRASKLMEENLSNNLYMKYPQMLCLHLKNVRNLSF